VNEFMDNHVTRSDPGFANAAKGDFRPKPSTAAALGFARIPLEEIGLYRDEFRRQ